MERGAALCAATLKRKREEEEEEQEEIEALKEVSPPSRRDEDVEVARPAPVSAPLALRMTPLQRFAAARPPGAHVTFKPRRSLMSRSEALALSKRERYEAFVDIYGTEAKSGNGEMGFSLSLSSLSLARVQNIT